MKKLEIWRRQARDGLPTDTPVRAGESREAANDPSPVARHDDDPVEQALQALRRAALLQHEDTEPAAFYRVSGD